MLTRESILDAALALTRRVGLEGLSQRKLAAELGVSAMAMYRHFPDKGALVDELLDHAIDPEALVACLRGVPLEEGLVRVFRSLRALFLAEPALVRLAGTPASLGPNQLRFLDALLAELAAAGKDHADSVRLVQAALSYTLGASITAASAAATQGESEAAARFAELDIATHPAVVAAAPALLGFVSSELFEVNLRALIAERLDAS